jgi:hypothetical protein
VLRQLLLLPLLAPLAAVILVGALNPKPAVTLRLLTYTSPALPIGVWMMLAGGGGGLLSAGTTALALRGGNGGVTRRQVRLPHNAEPAWSGREGWRAAAPRDPEPSPASPSRAPGEPAPTVEVPFRVIRRAPSSQQASTAPVDGWDEGDSDW